MDDDSGTGDGNAHRGGDGSHDALVYMDIGLPGGGTAVIGNPGKGDSRGTSLPVDGRIGRYGSGPREDHIGIPPLVGIIQVGLVIGRNHVAAGMEAIRIEPVGAFPVVPQGIGRINAAQLTPLGFVHVINQQALGGIGIPALAAAVLIDKVFSLHVCVGAEGLVPVHGPQTHLAAGHGLCIFICHPAQQDFLLGAQVRGRFGVIVIATVVHQGEVVHSAGNAAAALAVRVIEIRHSQRVAEFVGRGAHPADVGSAAAPQFGGHKEPVHLHAIGLELHTRLIGRQAGVGPYGVFRAVFGLVVTGIKHQEHIHLAVSVGVVAGQAHLLCQMQEGFIQEIYGIHILPGAGKAVDEILPVIGHIVLEVIGAVDIENRLKDAAGVLIVVVPDRARGSVVTVPRPVKHIGNPGGGVIQDVFHVRKVHQNHREMTDAGGDGLVLLLFPFVLIFVVIIVVFVVIVIVVFVVIPAHKVPPGRPVVPVAFPENGAPEAVLVLFHPAAGFVGIPVDVGVAVHLQQDGGAVGLGKLHLSGHGRKGGNTQADKEGQKDQQ